MALIFHQVVFFSHEALFLIVLEVDLMKSRLEGRKKHTFMNFFLRHQETKNEEQKANFLRVRFFIIIS